MTPIADMVAQMLAAGVPHDAIVLAVRTAESVARSGIQVENRVDEAAEKRRRWDREYRQRRKGDQVESTRNPPEIHPNEKPPLILSSKEEVPNEEKKVRGQRKRAGPIPPDWKPPERAHELARELGLRVTEIEPRFRDYLASSGKLYADYDAGFCNFVRNTPKFSGPNGAPNGQRSSSLAAAADRFIADARDREEPQGDGFLDLTVAGR